jgi:hypothetical protein
MCGPAIASHNAMSAIRTAARRSDAGIIIFEPVARGKRRWGDSSRGDLLTNRELNLAASPTGEAFCLAHM